MLRPSDDFSSLPSHRQRLKFAAARIAARLTARIAGGRRFSARAAMLAGLLMIPIGAPPAARAAVDPADAQKLYDRVRPSLVAVEYTWNTEAGRHDFIGEGVVVGSDGLVVVSEQLIPSALPNEQLTDFKIIVPAAGNGEDKEIDAVFQGRDDRTGLAFIKTKEPQKWTALKFVEEPAKVGDTVLSIGLLPKIAGYRPYLSETIVSTPLRGPVPQVLVSREGLGVLGSPVFNTAGDAIGMVNFDGDQSVLLNDTSHALSAVNNPPRLFVPSSDFLASLADPPTVDHPLELPWMGVAHLTGLKKEVADFYGLKGRTAVQIGDVIPGYCAEKAGLKTGDIIVKFNGEPLKRGDDPDEAAGILMRQIQRLEPGDVITLSLMRDKDKPLEEVKIKLDQRPKQANSVARFFAEDLGFTARDTVIDDTYERKLPLDTQGVVIAFVRPNSAASAAHLAATDFVTKFNQNPVTNLKQFKKDYQQFRKDHPKDSVVLEVDRGGGTEVIRIEPPQ